MTTDALAIGDLFAKKTESVNPVLYAQESFELFSVPSYQHRHPEVVKGAEIGSTKVAVLPGDVLLCKIVPHIRRAWVVPPQGDIRQIGSGEWIIFRDNRFHPDYLRHVVLGDSFHAMFMATVAGVGGSLMRARPAHVARIPIKLPPLPEQRRIAAILDQADELRTKRRRALTLLDELADSLFVDMFGGEDTQDLSEVCTPHSGGTPSKSTPEFWVGKLPWFSPKDLKSLNLSDAIDHVNPVVLEKTTLRLIPADTVAIVVRGMILAHTFPVARLRVPCTINQDMKALMPKNGVDPAFLAYALRSQRRQILSAVSTAGHGTKRLDTESLKAIQIPVASLERQALFRGRIDKIENARAVHVNRANALDELFASLQHRAFRGEL
jgi:hypothetical protein